MYGKDQVRTGACHLDKMEHFRYATSPDTLSLPPPTPLHTVGGWEGRGGDGGTHGGGMGPYGGMDAKGGRWGLDDRGDSRAEHVQHSLW